MAGSFRQVALNHALQVPAPARTALRCLPSLSSCFSTTAGGAGLPASTPAPVSGFSFETLAVKEVCEHVFQVELNRPEKSNAMNKAMWREIGEAFHQLGRSSKARAVVLSAAGKNFTSGLDLADHMEAFSNPGGLGEAADTARKAFVLRDLITGYQASMSALERCQKPVIAAVHSACIGGGVDLVCAADIRLASADAWFCVKEAEIGLAADVGTLQRLPKIIGNDSIARELCLTARRWTADEAMRIGFLSSVARDREELLLKARAMAERIAGLSPVAVQGTKLNMNFSRDRSVQEGLDYMAAWNMSMLQTSDIMESVQAGMSKGKKPSFGSV